jgi:hypothetical protein
MNIKWPSNTAPELGDNGIVAGKNWKNFASIKKSDMNKAPQSGRF